MDIITIIIWAALVQGLLLGMIFIFSKKHRSFANLLLGTILIAFVFEALTSLLPYTHIGNYSISGYFTLPEVKFLFPVLFLHFVLEKVGKKHSYRIFLKFHYIIAFSILSLTLVNLILFFILKSSLVDLFGWQLLEYFYMAHQYYAFVLTLVVFLIALKETYHYRNIVRNEITDISMLNINWLWQYIFGMAPIILFWGAELLRIARGGRGQTELTIWAFLFVAIFIYLVSLKAFLHRSLFEGSVYTQETFKKKISDKDDPNATIDIKVCHLIQQKMETQKYYLNQHLTLHDLSKEIEISARIISTCINQNLGLNFNEWVNNYRVEFALKILHDHSNNHFSIEGVGTDSGFKSRSAMYSAFKKKTGQTPGHFRSL